MSTKVIIKKAEYVNGVFEPVLRTTPIVIDIDSTKEIETFNYGDASDESDSSIKLDIFNEGDNISLTEDVPYAVLANDRKTITLNNLQSGFYKLVYTNKDDIVIIVKVTPNDIAIAGSFTDNNSISNIANTTGDVPPSTDTWDDSKKTYQAELWTDIESTDFAISVKRTNYNNKVVELTTLDQDTIAEARNSGGVFFRLTKDIELTETLDLYSGERLIGNNKPDNTKFILSNQTITFNYTDISTIAENVKFKNITFEFISSEVAFKNCAFENCKFIEEPIDSNKYEPSYIQLDGCSLEDCSIKILNKIVFYNTNVVNSNYIYAGEVIFENCQEVAFSSLNVSSLISDFTVFNTPKITVNRYFKISNTGFNTVNFAYNQTNLEEDLYFDRVYTKPEENLENFSLAFNVTNTNGKAFYILNSNIPGFAFNNTGSAQNLITIIINSFISNLIYTNNNIYVFQSFINLNSGNRYKTFINSITTTDNYTGEYDSSINNGSSKLSNITLADNIIYFSPNSIFNGFIKSYKPLAGVMQGISINDIKTTYAGNNVISKLFTIQFFVNQLIYDVFGNERALYPVQGICETHNILEGLSLKLELSSVNSEGEKILYSEQTDQNVYYLTESVYAEELTIACYSKTGEYKAKDGGYTWYIHNPNEDTDEVIPVEREGTINLKKINDYLSKNSRDLKNIQVLDVYAKVEIEGTDKTVSTDDRVYYSDVIRLINADYIWISKNDNDINLGVSEKYSITGNKWAEKLTKVLAALPTTRTKTLEFAGDENTRYSITADLNKQFGNHYQHIKIIGENYPVFEFEDGALIYFSDENQPAFSKFKINGNNLTFYATTCESLFFEDCTFNFTEYSIDLKNIIFKDCKNLDFSENSFAIKNCIFDNCSFDFSNPETFGGFSFTTFRNTPIGILHDKLENCLYDTASYSEEISKNYQTQEELVWDYYNGFKTLVHGVYYGMPKNKNNIVALSTYDITHTKRPSISKVFGAMEIPVYYVNCYTGDDNNLGTSFDKPFKTIDRALKDANRTYGIIQVYTGEYSPQEIPEIEGLENSYKDAVQIGGTVYDIIENKISFPFNNFKYIDSLVDLHHNSDGTVYINYKYPFEYADTTTKYTGKLVENKRNKKYYISGKVAIFANAGDVIISSNTSKIYLEPKEIITAYNPFNQFITGQQEIDIPVLDDATNEIIDSYQTYIADNKDNLYHLFVVKDTENVYFKNINFKGGCANTYPRYRHLVRNKVDKTINYTYTYNGETKESSYNVPAIYESSLKNFTKEFECKHENFGGAIHILNSEVKFENCKFDHNESHYHGAAIYNKNSTVLIYSGEFKYNKSQDGGGVVYSNGLSNTYINGARFEKNSVATNGGALYVSSCKDSVNYNDRSIYYYDCNLTVQNSRFVNNAAENGILYTRLNGCHIDNNLFLNNIMGDLNAAAVQLSNYNNSDRQPNVAIIANTVFYNNDNIGMGTPASVYTGFDKTKVILQNNILYSQALKPRMLWIGDTIESETNVNPNTIAGCIYKNTNKDIDRGLYKDVYGYFFSEFKNTEDSDLGNIIKNYEVIETNNTDDITIPDNLIKLYDPYVGEYTGNHYCFKGKLTETFYDALSGLPLYSGENYDINNIYEVIFEYNGESMPDDISGISGFKTIILPDCSTIGNKTFTVGAKNNIIGNSNCLIKAKGSNLIVKDLVFENTKNTQAIACEEGTTLSVYNCTFSNNTQNSAVGPCGEIYNNGSNTTIISNSYFGPNTATSMLASGTTSDTGSVIGNRSNKSLVVFNCNFENISFEGDSVIAVYKDPATHISDIKPIEDFILFNNTVDLSKSSLKPESWLQIAKPFGEGYIDVGQSKDIIANYNIENNLISGTKKNAGYYGDSKTNIYTGEIKDYLVYDIFGSFSSSLDRNNNVKNIENSRYTSVGSDYTKNINWRYSIAFSSILTNNLEYYAPYILDWTYYKTINPKLWNISSSLETNNIPWDYTFQHITLSTVNDNFNKYINPIVQFNPINVLYTWYFDGKVSNNNSNYPYQYHYTTNLEDNGKKLQCRITDGIAPIYTGELTILVEETPLIEYNNGVNELKVWDIALDEEGRQLLSTSATLTADIINDDKLPAGRFSYNWGIIKNDMFHPITDPDEPDASAENVTTEPFVFNILEPTVGVDSGDYKIRINFKPDNYAIGRNFFGKEFFKDGKDTITVDVLNGIKIDRESSTHNIITTGDVRIHKGDEFIYTLVLNEPAIFAEHSPVYEWQKVNAEGNWVTFIGPKLFPPSLNANQKPITTDNEIQNIKNVNGTRIRAWVYIKDSNGDIVSQGYSNEFTLKVLPKRMAGNEMSSNIAVLKIPFGQLGSRTYDATNNSEIYTTASNYDLFDDNLSSPVMHIRGNTEQLNAEYKTATGNFKTDSTGERIYKSFAFPTDISIDGRFGEYAVATNDAEHYVYILDIVNINFDSANKINVPVARIKLPTEATTADDKINIIRFGYSATMYGDYIAVSDPYAYTDAKTHIDYFSGRVFLFKFDTYTKNLNLIKIIQAPENRNNINANTAGAYGLFGTKILFDDHNNLLISAPGLLQKVKIGYSRVSSASPEIYPSASYGQGSINFETSGAVYVYNISELISSTNILEQVDPKQILTSQYFTDTIDYTNRNWGQFSDKFFYNKVYTIKSINVTSIDEQFATYPVYEKFDEFNRKYDFSYRMLFPEKYTEQNFANGESGNSNIKISIDYSYFAKNTNEFFGSALSYKNNILLISAPKYKAGFIELWKYENGLYRYSQSQTRTESTISSFGENVEMGETFALVSYKTNFSRQVAVYDYSSSNINSNPSLSLKIDLKSIAGASSFGMSMDSYKNTFVIASPDESKIYRYSYEDSKSSQIQLIDLEKQHPGITFGNKITCHNDKLLASYRSYGTIDFMGQGAILQYSMIGGEFRLA